MIQAFLQLFVFFCFVVGFVCAFVAAAVFLFFGAATNTRTGRRYLKHALWSCRPHYAFGDGKRVVLKHLPGS